MPDRLRILFFGTAEFAVPSLRALASRQEVALVVTQPDRPLSLRQPHVIEHLRMEAPDLIVVAAYGLILPQAVLDIPRYQCLNIHASLLPRHRGAAPIVAAILAGDAETGVTIMLMDAGMDTGPILRQEAIPIAEEDTTATLTVRLAELGARLVVPTVEDWVAGKITPQVQDHARATYAPEVKREDGILDWSKDTLSLWRQVRAMNPWPGATTTWHGKLLKILRARPLAMPGQGTPGTVVQTAAGTGVVTGDGVLVLEEVQPAGKRAMRTDEFLRGRQDFVGSVLQSGSLPAGETRV